jgi:CMP-N,N'-diacetyllegionaminic acid synthase
MINDLSVIAVIPARGGSKGLPGKNIRPLLGKPLIGWSIEQAFASKYIDEVVVSSDCPEIIEISRKFGANVPFKRPAKLASDNSTTIDVLIHCLDWFEEKNKSFDILVLLEPTSPIREVSDIDNSLRILISKEQGSVVSVCKTEGQNPAFCFKKNDDSKINPYLEIQPTNLRRQEIEPVYFLDGTIYSSFTSSLRNQKSFYHNCTFGFEVPKWKSLEIDDIVDFSMVESVMRHRNFK